MKIWTLAGALSVGLGALTFVLLARSPVAAAEGPHWLPDYETARAAALKAHKPLLVAFR